MRSLGIDVGVRKGLDLVLLDEALVPVERLRRVPLDGLAVHIGVLEPDTIAIDAPPAWGSGNGASRLTERELRRFGIQAFNTPSDPRMADHPFYAWMSAGFEVFRVVARCGFPRYRGGSARRKALEVFPHASAVVLSGCLPARDEDKRSFRRLVLERQGVDARSLRSLDALDAALAALTGMFALHGRSFAPGDPREGVIVLPSRALPPPPYRRCEGAEPSPRAQPHLPGLSPCACGDPGCVSLTASEFAPGHDAKRKSLLWASARLGDEASRELRRRGWELPPEMR